MGLIAQPAIECDVAKGMIGRQHHLLRELDAPACDIGERSLTECCLEGSKEMSSADSGEPNKLGTPDRPIEILLNVRYQAFRLPTGQLATESALCLRSALAFQTGCKQRRRTGQACLRSLMIELNLGLRYGEQLQQ